MECLEAQTTISEALDGTPIDATWLTSAKQHCRECSECGAFVRGLAVIKRAPLPQPPAGLADSVMIAVRAEAAENARREARTPEEVSARMIPATESESLSEHSPDATFGSPDSSGPLAHSLDTAAMGTDAPGRARTSPFATIAWASAAAVFLLGIGVVAIGGIRQMSSGSLAKSSAIESEYAGSSTQDTARAPSATDDSTQEVAPSAQPASSSNDFVSFNGFAYRLVGPEAMQRSSLSDIGMTTTSLDSTTPRARTVKALQGSSRIYLEDDRFQILAFEPVFREFEGRSYQLSTRDISGFGTWPMLPSQIAAPSQENGAPSFVEAQGTGQEVKIYRLAAGTVGSGIAVAPGSPASDPAGGNPNWTWWTPAK